MLLPLLMISPGMLGRKPGGGHPNRQRQKLSSTQALKFEDDYAQQITYHEDEEILAVIHAFLMRKH